MSHYGNDVSQRYMFDGLDNSPKTVLVGHGVRYPRAAPILVGAEVALSRISFAWWCDRRQGPNDEMRPARKRPTR